MTHTPGLPLLRESRVKLAEYARQRHHVVPEDDTRFEDLMQEAYWAAVAYMFKPCDIIEVHAEDGSYYAELYVRACGRNWAKVAVLSKVALEPVGAALLHGVEEHARRIGLIGPRDDGNARAIGPHLQLVGSRRRNKSKTAFERCLIPA